MLIKEVIDYFKRLKPNYKLPKIEIVNCISPIIEIYKNEKYSLYIDELNKLNPFSHDGFLYLKLDKNEYALFFGILMDKKDLIYNLFMFLARISIPVIENNFTGVSFKRILKYRQTIYLMSNFLFEIEGFEEIDIYKYFQYIYMRQLQYFQSYDFERQYGLMLQNIDTQQSFDLYKRNIGELSKLIGIYLGLVDNFSNIWENIPFPLTFNGTFSLFNEIIELFEIDKTNKEGFNHFKYALNKWYYENIEPVNIIN